jgi:hypothetical protein
MILTKMFLPIIAGALLAQTEPAKEDGFESLFDGKSLAGWYGPTDGYEVKDGAISAKPGWGGTIYTRRAYADFVARFEVKLPPGGNSGLAIRYPGSGHPAYVGMCEIQILDDTAEKHKKIDPRERNGSAYGLVAAKPGPLKIGEWNSGEMTVKGSTVQVKLNGTTILDADLSTVTTTLNNHPHPGKDRASGHFGITGDGDPAQFRNIRIKKLAP